MDPTKQDIDWDWETGLVAWFFIIGLAIYWLYPIINKNVSDNFAFEDGNAVFTEAKCPLGSIFHKDIIILTDENAILRSHSFWGNISSTKYPYHLLREVNFSKSIFGYKLVIKYPGRYWGTDSTTFYFNRENTFNNLYNQFRIKSHNRCIISESF